MARHESEVIDQYIDALLHDPQSPPPHGLDAELAQFVRTLVLSESEIVNTAISNSMQARVWRKARIAAQLQKREQIMIAENRLSLKVPLGKRITMPGLLTLLTIVVVLAFIGAAAAFLTKGTTPNPNNNNGTNGAIAGSQARPTGTPSPAPFEILPVTSTPLGWQGSDPNVTATPIGYQPSDPNATATPIGYQPFDPNATPTIIPGTPASTPIPVLPVPTVPPPFPTTLPDAEPQSLNQVITASLSAEAPARVYEFEFTEDGMISALLSSPNFSGLLSYQYIEAGSSGGGGGGGGAGGDSYIPQSQMISYVRKGGKLQIIVSSAQSGVYGEFQLSVFFAAPQPLEVASTQVSTVDQQQQVLFYTFQGVPGSLVDISVTGEDVVDLDMMLVEVSSMQGSLNFIGMTRGCSRGSMVYCEDADSGSGKNPELTDVLIRSNVLHAVIVRSAYPLTDPVQTTQFSIRMDRRDPITPTNGQSMIKLSPQTPANAVTLDGKANALISLTVSHNRGAIPAEILVLQNGYVLQQINLDPVAAQSLNIIPPMDGPVVVMAQYSSAYNNGSMNLPPLEIGVRVN
ncbi:MAG: hypothetical protein KF726_24520 [Anaerolineae bacterium]|nr:hypothetical protein [Anaerolineae bacterium]